MSNVKVFVLLAGLTGLLVSLGGGFGGQGGMVVALVFAGVLNVGLYYGSAKLVLRMYGARVIEEGDAPALYALVDRLRQRAGLPMPVLAIAPQPQPNAFATGRSPEHAVVCVTEGLLRLVNREELEGVIAHELAHIRNRDMLLQTVTATVAGAISNLANFGLLFGTSSDEEGGNPVVMLLMALVAPIAAMVIQFAISRQREFEADALGAEISGRPLALASALRKLELGAQQRPMHISPAVAPLAQVNPLAGRGGRLLRLFSTHPPTAERITRLEELAQRVRLNQPAYA